MTNRVFLEKPSRLRQAEFLALVQQSRAYHRPWVEPPATEAAFAAYLKRCRGKPFRGFFVCVAENRGLAGVINISQIVGGNFQSAYLGYYGFRATSGQGYMAMGLAQVLDLTFSAMKLHRLEANIQPENVASNALVKRLGFRLEGYSPKYLKVRGRWRDHERWCILAEDWRNHRRRLRLS